MLHLLLLLLLARLLLLLLARLRQLEAHLALRVAGVPALPALVMQQALQGPLPAGLQRQPLEVRSELPLSHPTAQ